MELEESLKIYETDVFQMWIGGGLEDEEGILTGTIDFYNYVENENIENTENFENKFCHVRFYIFDCYSPKEFWWLSDSISSDLEYVASSFFIYADNIESIGSIMVIDEIKIFDKLEKDSERIKLIRYILSRIVEIFTTLGTGMILFMTKALMLDCSNTVRRKLVNEIMKEGFVPIHQDDIDVVCGKNLNLL